MEDPVVPSERNLYCHPLAGLLWERQFGKALLEHGWVKSFEVGMLFRELRKSTILVCVCGWYETGCEETKHLPNVERSCEKGVLGEPTSFLDHVQLGCSQRECQIRKDIVRQLPKYVTNPGFLPALWKSYHFPRIRMRIFPHGPMTWKVMQRSAWKDIANWQTKQLNSYTKSQHNVLTTTNSKKKKWYLWENCQRFADKLILDASPWRASVDLTFYGP